MENWIKILDKININFNNRNSKRIIEKLNQTKKLVFQFDKRGDRTRLIKKELSKLGHELCYKVYTNRLLKEDIEDILNYRNTKCKDIGNSFANKEWLFDLHWYTEDKNKPYFPISLPLVMECEWSNIRYSNKEKDKNITKEEKKYSAVKYDFQKLVVSNAVLRLLIFRINQTANKEKDLKMLYKYFYEVINSYNHLEKNANFLFVVYDDKINSFYYCEIRKDK